MATSSGAASRRQVSPAAGTRRSARASIRALDDAYAFRYDEIASLRREGRKVVGYVCNYFPVELVHALGAIPIRLAFCSADAMERGKKYVGDSMCPFTRALVGEVTQEGSFTNQHVDFLSGAVMCQQAYNALRVLSYQTKKPLRFLWLVDFPLFEALDADGRPIPAHHAFTMPHPDDLDRLESDPLSVRSQSYDRKRSRSRWICTMASASGSRVCTPCKASTPSQFPGTSSTE